jgi:Xaa-Pro aminopeptidase
VKSPEEIGLIQRATEITEKSMEDALEIAQPAIMEIDMARMYNYSVAEDGGKVSHDYIGFGERSAYPNPIPTTLLSSKGNLIRMKLGATWMRYNGTVARTALLGESSNEIERRLKSVIDAQEAAFDLLKPGVKMSEVYTAIQRELAKAGLKECSTGFGHCIGIDCHEWPWIISTDLTEVEEGMVLNIGVPYLELGWGGIELEDTIQVTKKGFKLLTNTERTIYML